MLQTQRSHTIFGLIALIMFIAFSCIYLRQQKKINRIREATMRRRAENLLTELTDARHKSTAATKETQEAFAKSHDHANTMLETDYASKGVGLKKKHMLALMETVLDKVKSTDRLPELEKSINELSNNCIDTLRAEVPSVTDEEIRLFALTHIGLSPKAISVVMKMTVKNVYGKRHKLKNKIRLSEAPHIDMLMETFDQEEQ